MWNMPQRVCHYYCHPILALVMLNILCTTLHPNFYPVNLQHSNCKQAVENCVDPDEMASSEAS